MGSAKGGSLNPEELCLFVSDGHKPLDLLDELFFEDKILFFPLF